MSMKEIEGNIIENDDKLGFLLAIGSNEIENDELEELIIMYLTDEERLMLLYNSDFRSYS